MSLESEGVWSVWVSKSDERQAPGTVFTPSDTAIHTDKSHKCKSPQIVIVEQLLKVGTLYGLTQKQ